MGTIFLEKHFSPFDILVKNFFNTEEQFQTPTNRIINHPVDIYEDKNGLYFDIACTGLTKKMINVDVEEDVLRVSYDKKELDKIEEPHFYHSGIAKRNFNLGWKIARRFDLTKASANMENGLLKILVPFSKAAKPKSLKIQ